MKNTNIIRNFAYGFFLLLLISGAVFAAPVVFKDNGSLTDLDPIYYQFGQAAAHGGNINSGANSYPNGIRQITWDEVPPNFGNVLPNDYYNTVVPNGVMLSSDCTSDGFALSGTETQSSYRFKQLNANYQTAFSSYTGERLFSVSQGGCNILNVNFFVPGTRIPATVNAFAAVFADVDTAQSTVIEYYGVDGKKLIPQQTALARNNGLSFLGVLFNEGERIARVRILSGTAPLGEVDKSSGGERDVVVMDTFIYGEPRAVGHQKSDFDGDGTSDYAVFRPSNGAWYVLNSGSNTFQATQFGANGDVPVEGDFDGDSRNDFAVFRPANSAWYILRSSTGQVQGAAFGQAGDKPVVGDYDKDGKTDIAVWRPSNGIYYYLKSSTGQLGGAQFGANGDIPIGASVP